MSVKNIPGTARQALFSTDGIKLERQYIYLPEVVWKALQQLAKKSGTSVSQQIQSFAISGNVLSKEFNEPIRPTS